MIAEHVFNDSCTESWCIRSVADNLDRRLWSLEAFGNFSVKSLTRHLSISSPLYRDLYQALWKSKCPRRVNPYIGYDFWTPKLLFSHAKKVTKQFPFTLNMPTVQARRRRFTASVLYSFLLCKLLVEVLNFWSWLGFWRIFWPKCTPSFFGAHIKEKTETNLGKLIKGSVGRNLV